MIIIQGSKSTLSTFKKSGAKIVINWIRGGAKIVINWIRSGAKKL
jgi:hypothetical protein